MSEIEIQQVKRPTTSQSVPKRCWMYWRHSCCRYGWYPAFVAPVLTIACLLSLYSAGGCEFIKVHVGFTPQPNLGWNESEATLGFWYHGEDGVAHDFDYVPVYGDCQLYQDGFDDVFIEKDRTWKVARIMALVAGGASTLSACLAWLYCLSPLPTGCLWPAFFLPVVMIAFIAEGSKFLIFDVGVCRTSVWLPSGVNSLPQTAESCELGESAYFSIGSGAFLLVGLLLVCLKVPHERELDPHFGAMDPEYPEAEDSNEETDEHEHSDNYEDFDDVVEEYPSPRTSAARQESVVALDEEQAQLDHATLGDETDKMARDASEGSKVGTMETTKQGGDDDSVHASESRLNALANMEASQQEKSFGNRLLEKLVNDLNCSYQTTQPVVDE